MPNKFTILAIILLAITTGCGTQGTGSYRKAPLSASGGITQGEIQSSNSGSSSTPVTIFKGELNQDYRGSRQASIEYDPHKGIYDIHFDNEKEYPALKLCYEPDNKVLPVINSGVNYDFFSRQFSYQYEITNREAKTGEIAGDQQYIYVIHIYYSKGVSLSDMDTPTGWHTKNVYQRYVDWIPQDQENNGIAPGQSLTGFKLKSLAPPGINEARLSGCGWELLDEFPEPLASEVAKLHRKPQNNYVSVKTIAPDFLPSVEPDYLLDRINALTGEALQLNWLDQASYQLITKNLNQLKLTLQKFDYKAAEQNLNSLTQTLTNLKASGTLNLNGYALIVPNLGFIKAQMTSPDKRVTIPAPLKFKTESLQACKDNMYKIGIAGDKYYMDPAHYKQFPHSLADLVAQGYADKLPQCPEGGEYSCVWPQGKDYEAFTIYCTGRHKGITKGYPQCVSVGGAFKFLDKPEEK